jgi:hypothetical protein
LPVARYRSAARDQRESENQSQIGEADVALSAGNVKTTGFSMFCEV